MKTRLGFVSNSSNCSFTVKLERLTALQLTQILDYENVAKALSEDPANDYKAEFINGCWTVMERPDTKDVYFSTYMDNLDMEEFLQYIGVPADAIQDRAD